MDKKERLYRSRKDRILFGVCGGLAKYFNFDPALMRILFVVVSIADGIGILFYLLLLIVIPREPGEPVEVNRKEKIKSMVDNIGDKAQDFAAEVKHGFFSRRELVGFGFVLIGAWLLIRKLFPYEWSWVRWSLVLPVIIITAGAIMLLKSHKTEK